MNNMCFDYLNDNGKKDVISAKVGQLAYGIWKALNSREMKKEQNLKDVEANPIDYTEGQKVENLELIVKDARSIISNSSWGYKSVESTELITKDPKTDFTVKIRLGRNTSKALADLLNLIKRSGMFKEFETDPLFESLHKVTVSGKILRINKEYKSLTLNYVTIISPTDNEINEIEKIVLERNRENTRIQTMRKNIKDDLSSLEFINKHIEIAPDKIKANQDFINEILENLTPALEVLTDEEKTQFENVKSFIEQA